MTKNEFLAKLEQTPRNWHTSTSYPDSQGSIRNSERLCPIEALDGSWYHDDGGLGLAHGVKSAILNAADGANTKLRSELLKACSL